VPFWRASGVTVSHPRDRELVKTFAGFVAVNGVSLDVAGVDPRAHRPNGAETTFFNSSRASA